MASRFDKFVPKVFRKPDHTIDDAIEDDLTDEVEKDQANQQYDALSEQVLAEYQGQFSADKFQNVKLYIKSRREKIISHALRAIRQDPRIDINQALTDIFKSIMMRLLKRREK